MIRFSSNTLSQSRSSNKESELLTVAGRHLCSTRQKFVFWNESNSCFDSLWRIPYATSVHCHSHFSTGAAKDSQMILNDWFERHLETHLKEPEKYQDGLGRILQKLGREGIDKKELLRDLNHLFCTCVTLYSAFNFMFVALAEHPQTWKKLLEEIDKLETTDITMETLKRMKYLSNWINEVRRYYPLLAAAYGKTKKSFTFGDGEYYYIPKGW